MDFWSNLRTVHTQLCKAWLSHPRSSCTQQLRSAGFCTSHPDCRSKKCCAVRDLQNLYLKCIYLLLIMYDSLWCIYIYYIYWIYVQHLFMCIFVLFIILHWSFHIPLDPAHHVPDFRWFGKAWQLLRHLIHVGLTVDFVDSIASCRGRKCCHVLLRGTVCVCVSLSRRVCLRACLRARLRMAG